MVFHGHYPDDISGFRTTPPDPNLQPDYSERFHLAGYNRIQQQEAYAFYQKWISADFPRFLVIEIEHANPFYDDSYAVNSANLGPYGDAINKELIPEIERRFRGIGAGWARFTYGGSTGGWEALATQVFYPDMYNGAFAACPDPIDFRAYTLIDIYKDRNAYFLKGEASSVERPAFRNYLGEVFATQRDENYMELAQGDRSRSGGQYDIWQAVFGPVGTDGYPKPIFDKVSGVIDPVGGRVLARSFRSVVHHRPRLEDTSSQAARENPSLRGQRRQLLSDRFDVFRTGAARSVAAALRRIGGVRRSRRALLEWRPEAG